MADIDPFGLTLLIAAAVVSVALLSNRISGRPRIPAPFIFLVASAAASDLIPGIWQLKIGTVEQVVTVALIVILFDGGMRIGARKLRATLGTVLNIGVAGTFLTAGLLAVLAHLLFGFDWRVAPLLGTARLLRTVRPRSPVHARCVDSRSTSWRRTATWTGASLQSPPRSAPKSPPGPGRGAAAQPGPEVPATQPGEVPAPASAG